MTIAICLISGVVAAVCGCGQQKKGYHDLFKQNKKEEQPPPVVQVPQICGGTRIKMNKVTRWRDAYRGTPILQKHRRQTIRGMAA